MAESICPQCGAPIDPEASECRFCGEKLVIKQASQQVQRPQEQAVYGQQPQPQVVIQQTITQQQGYMTGINPSWPVKNKVLAGVLAIILGGFGIHKFYLGKIGWGILYLCFCWTWIPSVIGVIEGIIYLCSDNENFQLKHHVRLE